MPVQTTLSQFSFIFHFNNILYPMPFSQICMNVRYTQVNSSDRRFSSMCCRVIIHDVFWGTSHSFHPEGGITAPYTSSGTSRAVQTVLEHQASSLDVNVRTVHAHCQQSLQVENFSSCTGQFYKRNCPTAVQSVVFCSTKRSPGAVLRLNFKRRIKFRLPFAGVIRSSPYSTGFQDKG